MSYNYNIRKKAIRRQKKNSQAVVLNSEGKECGYVRIGGKLKLIERPETESKGNPTRPATSGAFITDHI